MIGAGIGRRIKSRAWAVARVENHQTQAGGEHRAGIVRFQREDRKVFQTAGARRQREQSFRVARVPRAAVQVGRDGDDRGVGFGGRQLPGRIVARLVRNGLEIGLACRRNTRFVLADWHNGGKLASRK